MEAIITIAILVFVAIWAYRLEMNTTKTVEALKRIEQKLDAKKGSK